MFVIDYGYKFTLIDLSRGKLQQPDVPFLRPRPKKLAAKLTGPGLEGVYEYLIYN